MMVPTSLFLTCLLSVFALFLSFVDADTIDFNLQTLIPAVRLSIGGDFPDPAFLQFNNTWYAFATNGNNKTVQVATSDDFVTWQPLDSEALPNITDWETDRDHWAPDVIGRDDGKFVLYYSGEAKQDIEHHCIGVAISESTDPAGPYIPNDEPFACHLEQGGAIDAAGFRDKNGTLFVTYKVDGNSIGHGGYCNNGIPPYLSTPIMLQRVEDDGFTKIGDPIQILDRDDSDGPLVEAPYIAQSDNGTYYLFYSTGCFHTAEYDVRYATSQHLEGPYAKASDLLIKTGDFGLFGPGGASIGGNGTSIMFHGECLAGRCMYTAGLDIQDDKIVVMDPVTASLRRQHREKDPHDDDKDDAERDEEKVLGDSVKKEIDDDKKEEKDKS